MKIAVIGCGALGSYYGARLCRDGQEAHFLLRSDFDVVRRHGVKVQSAEGDFVVHPRCARSPEEIGVADLVMIGLKTTANDQLPALLPPLLGPATAVLTMQNGLGNEEQLAALIPEGQILGGLCFVCLNRVAPGIVHHLDHGRVVLGEYRRSPQPRTHQICAMFQHAGIPCEVSDDLERAHWEKLVWNIAFNGLGVASSAGLETFVGTGPAKVRGPCLPTDQLLEKPGWLRIVRELMTEVVQAARAQKLSVDLSVVDLQIERTRTMGAYKASTLIDFERGQPLELESLFFEPMRRARRVGVETPRLARLCEVLREIDDSRWPRAEGRGPRAEGRGPRADSRWPIAEG